MNNKTLAAIVVIVALLTVALSMGRINQNYVDTEQVRTYADPITENILLAMIVCYDR